MLDAKRRAFLWTGDDTCNGANCLIAWDRVCQARDCGGLGIKNLSDVNHCLLMKFVHKLHEPVVLPWMSWFLSHAGTNLTGTPGSYLCSILKEEIPRYRSITSVSLGDGASTSFWYDHWMLNSTLSETFPALFSHCVHKDSSVRPVMTSSLRSSLQPRLTRAAEDELLILTDCLAQIALQDRSDVHFLMTNKRSPFSSSAAYSILQGPILSADVSQVWNVKLPTKIKFFAWLLFHGRLNTRAHLFHRNIKPLEESWCEQCPGVLETDVHIFRECRAAVSIWNRLHITLLGDVFRRPWELVLTNDLPKTVHVDMILLILWHVWKARNALVFYQQNLSTSDIIRKVLHDVDTWSCRYKKLRADVNTWRDWLDSCLT